MTLVTFCELNQIEVFCPFSYVLDYVIMALSFHLFCRMPDKKLPAVPETILKRRKRQAENRARRAKEQLVAKRQRHTKRVDIFKRAEKYVKEYRNKERDEIRLKREAKKNEGYVIKVLTCG